MSGTGPSSIEPRVLIFGAPSLAQEFERLRSKEQGAMKGFTSPRVAVGRSDRSGGISSVARTSRQEAETGRNIFIYCDG